MKKLFTLLFLSSSLCSCSSVEYLNKEQLANIFSDDEESTDSLSINSHTPASETNFNGGKTYNAKNLGSIVIGRFDKNGAKTNDPLVLNVKRAKSVIYAETMLFDSDNKDKTFFDQGAINVGLDRKNQGVNFSLTFKY